MLSVSRLPNIDLASDVGPIRLTSRGGNRWITIIIIKLFSIIEDFINAVVLKYSDGPFLK